MFQSDWGFGLLIVLFLIVAALGVLVGRQTVSEGASKAEVSHVVHHAAQQGRMRQINEDSRLQSKEEHAELPRLFREFSAALVQREYGTSSPEVEEALELLEASILGEIEKINPLIVKISSTTGEPVGLEASYMRPWARAAAKRAVNEVLGE
jgi:hypothetical protein